MLILKVVASLKEHKVPYAIVGGYAVALHGAVRGTLDIDIITSWSKENFILVEKALAKIGLLARIPIDPEELFLNREKYIQEKNLIAWNFANPKIPTEQVDVIITVNLSDCSTKSVEVQGENITIISKQHLIAMKKNSGRKQDLLDVDALERLGNE